MPRKIIQIAAMPMAMVPTDKGVLMHHSHLFALCDDATMWMLDRSKGAQASWSLIAAIPQTEIPIDQTPLPGFAGPRAV